MKIKDKKYGFTLAELLITLGLLGSLAALTIPTLSYNYRGKVLEQQFRSTYSELKEIASRINYEKGDVGDYAFNCVYSSNPNFHCGAQTADGKNKYSGTMRWASEVMSYISGGGSYDDSVTYASDIAGRLRKIYKDAGSSGPYRFNLNNSGQKVSATVFCDNGGIWSDSKGRLWSFNAESQLICVDINGTAAPNRLNIDTFVFKPMSAQEMAIYINDEDPDNPHSSNYSGQIIPCDADVMSTAGNSNKVNRTKSGGTNYKKGSGSAVDYCYFNEPIENIAAMPFTDLKGHKADVGTSARGKTVTRANNYWTDYINYR